MSQIMRVRSPLEQIRGLEMDLNGPDQPARLRAAIRINEIGCASAPDSRERTLSINALAGRLSAERDGALRQELERMIAGLRGTPARETAPAPETAGQGLVGRIVEAAASRALGLLAVVPRLAGCAAVWSYEGSVMEGETELVRGFTENLVQGETTTEDRVGRIVEWGQANLPHYYGDYQPEIYGVDLSSSGAANPMEVSIEQVFRERVVGCHLAVFTLVTMLRSIGIRADYISSESIGAGEGNHGILYLPELNRYVHGDNVCLVSNLLPTELLLETREHIIAIHDEADSVDPTNPPSSLGPVTDEWMSHIHCGGFLRRDGDSLIIEGGVVHAGYEATEFPRLQAIFPEFEITPGAMRADGFGTTFTTRRVPIVPLE